MARIVVLHLIIIILIGAACASRPQARQEPTPTPVIPPAEHHGPRPDCSDPATAAACRGMIEAQRGK